MNIQFVICTNAKNVHYTKTTIKSIKNVVKNPIIHIGGIINPFKDDPSLILHDFSNEAINGYVGKLRNKTIEKTTSDIIVYCDDDVAYPENWYDNFCKWNDINPNWNIMSNKIYLPNGGRYWDRAIIDNDTHTLVDYDHDILDKRLFFCATFFAIKRSCFNKNKFNETLKYYGGYSNKNMPVEAWETAEDLELSRRLYNNNYVIDFDKNNYVYHIAYDFLEIFRPDDYNFRNVTVHRNFLQYESEKAKQITDQDKKLKFESLLRNIKK